MNSTLKIICIKYLTFIIGFFIIQNVSCQEIDSLVLAKYELFSKNYKNALNIYDRNNKKMLYRDRIRECYCYHNLGDNESLCKKINLYRIPKFELDESNFSKDLIKNCSTADSTNIFGYNDLKIFHLFKLDQYIRTSSLVDSILYEYMEFYYIKNQMTEILNSINKFSDISEYSNSMIEVILLHQVRKKDFYLSNELMINKLFNLNIIDAHLYATLIDNYYQYNFGKQKYGTWNLWNKDNCIVKVFEPENIDKKRLEIGLPSFQYEPMFTIQKVKTPDWYKKE